MYGDLDEQNQVEVGMSAEMLTCKLDVDSSIGS